VRSSLDLKNTVQSVVATGVMSDRVVGLLDPLSHSSLSSHQQNLALIQDRNV